MTDLLPFVYREPFLIVADVIQNQLDLNPGQVMATNQKYEIPTKGMFIAVSYVGPSKIIANINEWIDDGAGGLNELQSITMLHMIQIDIMGYCESDDITQDVVRRKEEVAMALNSIYSEQQQEAYNMNIARHCSPFLDTSFLEETKMITRYTTTVMTTSVNRKKQPITDFYTDFTRAVPPTLVVNA